MVPRLQALERQRLGWRTRPTQLRPPPNRRCNGVTSAARREMNHKCAMLQEMDVDRPMPVEADLGWSFRMDLRTD